MMANKPIIKYKQKNTDAIDMFTMNAQLFVNFLTLLMWIIIVHDYIKWVLIKIAKNNGIISRNSFMKIAIITIKKKLIR